MNNALNMLHTESEIKNKFISDIEISLDMSLCNVGENTMVKVFIIS